MCKSEVVFSGTPHKLIILLFSAFLIFCFSSSAEPLVLKKDETTNETILTEEGPPSQDVAGEKGKDHISSHMLPGDLRFRQYISIVDEAVGNIQQGLYEQAVEKFKKAIILEPSMPYAYDNLSNAYYHLHKYEEAIAMSKNVLKMDPNYANAYGNLGSIYYAMGRYGEAKENYKKARELFQKEGDMKGVAKTDEYLGQSFSP